VSIALAETEGRDQFGTLAYPPLAGLYLTNLDDRLWTIVTLAIPGQ
jgi:hypothetical protein